MGYVLLIIAMLLIPFTCQAGVPGFMRERMGTMEGDFIVQGQPLPNAIVSFFDKEKGPPPIIKGAQRIPDMLTRSNAYGQFSVQLTPGKYYIGAMIRPPENGPGPPRLGEEYFFAVDADNNLRTFPIGKNENLNVGQVMGGHPEELGDFKNVFTARGRVIYEDNKPYKGGVVLAKDNIKVVRPGYVSDPTGEDGTFSIMLPAGKTYFLLARETMRGARPEPGSFLGTYGVTSASRIASPGSMISGSPPPGVLDSEKGSTGDPISITGKPGEIIAGITIKMFRVPDPAAIKAEIQGLPNPPQFEKGVTIDNIFFEPGNAKIIPSSLAELDKWASFLIGKPTVKIDITGHADSDGPGGLNIQLATERAQTVADYLVARGVSTERMSVTGKGENQPIASNDTPEGRMKNRRVEIRIDM